MATVSGTISAKATRSFVVAANYGRTATVSINNRSLSLWNDAVPKGESGSSSFETNSGDNEFGIHNPTNRAISYTLTISIQ